MNHPLHEMALHSDEPSTVTAKVFTLYLQVMDRLPHRLLLKDTHSVYIACNQRYADDFGLCKEQMAGRTDLNFFPAELAARYRADDRLIMASGKEHLYEEPYEQDGQTFWVETIKFALYDDHNKVIGIAAMFRDVTERRQNLEALRRQTWALQAMSACNQALVKSSSSAHLLHQVCEAMVQRDRYSLATLYRVDTRSTSPAIHLITSAGVARQCTSGLEKSWQAELPDCNPIISCARSGQVVILSHLRSSSGCTASQPDAHCGLSSVIALPLRLDETSMGVIAVFAPVDDAFGPEEEQLFIELVDNLQFGLESRRTKEAYEASLRRSAEQSKVMEKAMEDALAAIAAVLEQRDPYTAGHQTHVAELAMLIGRELGLEQERLHGLYLSAIVHDLGKIQIPAEILTKPARLNEAEFNLIKQHPEVGYRILRHIHFPWPIADIIRQHHECLDGSGYPQGLQGDDILLEARILSVADIVESMSSDRPYRPALGTEVALNQIRQMSGSKLDPKVVEACIRVVERGDFTPNLMCLAE
ncbi:HD domain-containing phosphohydrolase [Pokkaliibacter sp. MBI-7]|uniref:HD domain-containing phosphohydrolase n=1 Tax=Pokkaliibacter sp. MBI-7 TaxID=3040600 RepID=UPI002447EDB9|nr:HD domain-containing phosphohydrolase [Pokkaliibacter sp. MBI-7]MDH2436205.1 HD domain-containing phosphohydrolase [Pokkaliibacter sp. MBI-7]